MSAGAQVENGSGNPPARRIISITLPLLVEKQTPVSIEVTIMTNPQDMKFEAAPLLQGLEAILRPDLWKQLQAAAAAQGGLRMQSLKELGLDAVFDFPRKRNRRSGRAISARI